MIAPIPFTSRIVFCCKRTPYFAHNMQLMKVDTNGTIDAGPVEPRFQNSDTTGTFERNIRMVTIVAPTSTGVILEFALEIFRVVLVGQVPISFKTQKIVIGQKV